MNPHEQQRLIASGLEVVSLETLSHDLRTPLTSILGYLELILSGELGPLTPIQRRYLETVERNAKRLARTTVEIEFLADDRSEGGR